jgi:hypothetical protein
MYYTMHKQNSIRCTNKTLLVLYYLHAVTENKEFPILYFKKWSNLRLLQNFFNSTTYCAEVSSLLYTISPSEKGYDLYTNP